jgi:hypothetical protein
MIEKIISNKINNAAKSLGSKFYEELRDQKHSICKLCKNGMYVNFVIHGKKEERFLCLQTEKVSSLMTVTNCSQFIPISELQVHD